MSFELLFSKESCILIFNENKFYKNKVYGQTIYWYCCNNVNIKDERCPCVIHTNIQITKILKHMNKHNHPPTYTKNKLERQQCINQISLYQATVKQAFNTFSINHPQLPLLHFTKCASIKNQIYRKREKNNNSTIPKTFDGL